jgi:hypothetical protein
LTRLGLQTQDIARALDANIGHMSAGLARIESKIDAMEGENEGRHREQMAATEALRREIAREKGVDPAVLIPLFEHLGQKGLSKDE